MSDLFGPVAPWIGVVDAVGVLLVLACWLLLSESVGRVRAVATAAGGALLAVAFVTAFGGVRAVVTSLAFTGTGGEGGRKPVDAVLLVAGVAAGAVALYAARREVDEDVADDATLSWLSVAAALALPVVSSARSLRPVGDFYGDGEVTVAVVLLHLLTGLVVGGALLTVLHRDDASGSVVAGGFALVAAGLAAVPVWPVALSNEYWTVFGTGLAAGLFAAAFLPMLRAAVPDDRWAALAGALVVVALVAASAVAAGRVSSEYVARQQQQLNPG